MKNEPRRTRPLFSVVVVVVDVDVDDDSIDASGGGAWLDLRVGLFAVCQKQRDCLLNSSNKVYEPDVGDVERADSSAFDVDVVVVATGVVVVVVEVVDGTADEDAEVETLDDDDDATSSSGNGIARTIIWIEMNTTKRSNLLFYHSSRDWHAYRRQRTDIWILIIQIMNRVSAIRNEHNSKNY